VVGTGLLRLGHRRRICPNADLTTGAYPTFLGFAITAAIIDLNPSSPASPSPKPHGGRRARPAPRVPGAGVTTNARERAELTGWERLAVVAGRKTAISDGERTQAAQVQRIVSDRFVTHWSAQLAGLDLTQQLLVEGVAYEILDRKELGFREWLEWTVAAKPVTKREVQGRGLRPRHPAGAGIMKTGTRKGVCAGSASPR
jgi:hypothetical protein